MQCPATPASSKAACHAVPSHVLFAAAGLNECSAETVCSSRRSTAVLTARAFASAFLCRVCAMAKPASSRDRDHAEKDQGWAAPETVIKIAREFLKPLRATDDVPKNWWPREKGGMGPTPVEEQWQWVEAVPGLSVGQYMPKGNLPYRVELFFSAHADCRIDAFARANFLAQPWWVQHLVIEKGSLVNRQGGPETVPVQILLGRIKALWKLSGCNRKAVAVDRQAPDAEWIRFVSDTPGWNLNADGATRELFRAKGPDMQDSRGDTIDREKLRRNLASLLGDFRVPVPKGKGVQVLFPQLNHRDTYRQPASVDDLLKSVDDLRARKPATGEAKPATGEAGTMTDSESPPAAAPSAVTAAAMKAQAPPAVTTTAAKATEPCPTSSAAALGTQAGMAEPVPEPCPTSSAATLEAQAGVAEPAAAGKNVTGVAGAAVPEQAMAGEKTTAGTGEAAGAEGEATAEGAEAAPPEDAAHAARPSKVQPAPKAKARWAAMLEAAARARSSAEAFLGPDTSDPVESAKEDHVEPPSAAASTKKNKIRAGAVNE